MIDNMQIGIGVLKKNCIFYPILTFNYFILFFVKLLYGNLIFNAIKKRPIYMQCFFNSLGDTNFMQETITDSLCIYNNTCISVCIYRNMHMYYKENV